MDVALSRSVYGTQVNRAVDENKELDAQILPLLRSVPLNEYVQSNRHEESASSLRPSEGLLPKPDSSSSGEFWELRQASGGRRYQTV